ncbi:hypothetical protein [Nocardioides bruguierae]|uniref:hypothetical protein n=1 Tax=Nocardioides bruguierae TaxID=2945102 RepID=UPI0020227DA0|nr:hypothetical protein [Nocardioides bruguierae]MCL8026347.1 hypothetical protein [Nocardioides bruguierae]
MIDLDTGLHIVAVDAADPDQGPMSCGACGDDTNLACDHGTAQCGACDRGDACDHCRVEARETSAATRYPVAAAPWAGLAYPDPRPAPTWARSDVHTGGDAA